MFDEAFSPRISDAKTSKQLPSEAGSLGFTVIPLALEVSMLIPS